jgi:hypothetical protein
MTFKKNSGAAMRKYQRGVAAVEFALISLVFFTLLIGVMEMGRVLFYWNAATEATRLGARLAVVCDLNDTIIKTKMKMMLPILNDGDIDINYDPPSCAADSDVARSSCHSVTVEILPSVSVQTMIPFVSMLLTMPPFSTTLPRESMDSAVDVNPVCK